MNSDTEVNKLFVFTRRHYSPDDLFSLPQGA